MTVTVKKTVGTSFTLYNYKCQKVVCEAAMETHQHEDRIWNEEQLAEMYKEVELFLRDHLANICGFDIPANMPAYDYMLKHRVIFNIAIPRYTDENIDALVRLGAERSNLDGDNNVQCVYTCTPIQTASGLQMTWMMVEYIGRREDFFDPDSAIEMGGAAFLPISTIGSMQDIMDSLCGGNVSVAVIKGFFDADEYAAECAYHEEH